MEALNPGGSGAKPPLQSSHFLVFRRRGFRRGSLTAENKFSSDLRTPLSHPTLKSSELARGKGIRHMRLQPNKDSLRIGVGMFIEPFFNDRPGVLEGIGAGAPRPGSRVRFPMGRTSFSIPPSRRETLDKPAKFLTSFAQSFGNGPNLRLSQMLLGRPNFTQQTHWVEAREVLPQFVFAFVRHAAVGEQSFIRRGRRIILLGYLRTLANFRLQLERGLEEVHVQAPHLVEFTERGGGSRSLQPPVADQPPDNGSVLLFDPGLIVLFVRPGSRQLDLPTVSLMKAESLSTSRPSIANGSFARISSTVKMISSCCRTTIAAASVHPDAISVSTKLCA